MLQRLIDGLIDIVYPKKCLACKDRLEINSAEEFICSKCREKIQKNTPPFCRHCGRYLNPKKDAGNICAKCIRQPLSFDRAFSPCAYSGVIKELIHEFKYKNKPYLGKPLSEIMISFIREYNLPFSYADLVVPVPLHNARLREREFNQAEILSSHIAKELNINFSPAALFRKRSTRTQVDLKDEERFANVAGSFSINPKISVKGKNILLVDDVFTTGATTSEAAGVLKNAGAHIVFTLTLAN
jgi:ComF family protein